MTDTRLTAVFAALALTSAIACSSGPARTPPPVAQQALTPASVPATSSGAATAPAAASTAVPAASLSGTADALTITGLVAETMNSGNYTYARLETTKGDVWVAASEVAVKVGERLTVAVEMPMQNFHSTSLNRDFPLIYFVSQLAREGQTLPSPQRQGQGQPAAPGMMAAHQSAVAPIEKISPAPGGLSIADVWAGRTSLSGKPVVIRGKVVKVNNGIMDRNWLHLQDGSGSATDRTNDLTVTTGAEVKVGDIVTASGTLAIEKDFGSGYAYDAILENAKVTAK